MKKKTNLVARRTLELIKENSVSVDEYKENLIESIKVLNEELEREKSGKNKEPQQELIDQFVKDNKAEEIYKIIKAGAKGYNMDMLINAVIKIGNADAILSSVVIWKNKNITKAHFVKCAKALVELKAVEEIVHFSKYCYGNNTFYNSYNIISHLVNILAEDTTLMKDVIDFIDDMKATQGNTPSCYMPYGSVVTMEMRNFRDILYSKYLKNKREV